MDPNETLDRLRKWAATDYADGEPFEEAQDLFQALDEWLSKGGFLPADWEEGRTSYMRSSYEECPDD